MIVCLSYRNMGEIFTSDKYVSSWLAMVNCYHCIITEMCTHVCIYVHRDVVEAITVVDYLLSVLVYSDSFQVSLFI